MLETGNSTTILIIFDRKITETKLMNGEGVFTYCCRCIGDSVGFILLFVLEWIYICDVCSKEIKWKPFYGLKTPNHCRSKQIIIHTNIQDAHIPAVWLIMFKVITIIILSLTHSLSFSLSLLSCTSSISFKTNANASNRKWWSWFYHESNCTRFRVILQW